MNDAADTVPAVDQGLREKVARALGDATWGPGNWLGVADGKMLAQADAVLAVVGAEVETLRAEVAHLRGQGRESDGFRSLTARLRAERDAALAREGALRAGVEAVIEKLAHYEFDGTATLGELVKQDDLRALLVEPGGDQ
jgi:hypothetical protein